MNLAIIVYTFFEKYFANKKLMMINSIHVIEITTTSNLYSLKIPKLREISVKDKIARTKLMVDVHLIAFSSLFWPLNAGIRAKKDKIMNINPISSSTIKIPWGLNCVKIEIPSVSPASNEG